MKIFYIECTEEELRANRGIMDAIVDAVSGLMNGVYGNCTPATNEEDEEKGDDTE
jgi:hypothetical protein